MLTALLALQLAGAAPGTLSWSGRLLDAQGDPINGEQSLTLTLYGDDSTADERWTDTLEATVDNGYVTLELGDAEAPIDATVLAGGDVHLQVTVGSLSLPLQPLYPAPYAVVAEHTLDGVVEQRGTFTPTVHLFSGSCNGTPNITTTASGTYRRVGSLVHISITGLPTGATHAYHCIESISGLPFNSAAPAAFSISHARGIQFKYANTVHNNFTLSASLGTAADRIYTQTSHQSSSFSGYWYINGPDTGQYVQQISGTYIAVD